MNLRYILAILVSCMSLYGNTLLLHSQSRWTPQTSPTREQLRGVYFVDERRGWAVGNKGIILATQNGGQTWSIQPSGSDADLLDVFFLDNNLGWAVGTKGAYIPTTNGGTLWDGGVILRSSTNNRTPYNFSAVFFLDSLRGWLAADSGAVLVTRDGGRQWFLQNTGTKNDISSVYFVNANLGWASANGSLLRTSNGGQTWTTQVTYSNVNFNWLHFADSARGWAVGNSGAIIATTDGGRTWAQQRTETSQTLAIIKFINPRIGWAVGAGGTILNTTDGGATWRTQTSGISTDIIAASFVDSTRGWAVGSNGIILSYAPSVTSAFGINGIIVQNGIGVPGISVNARSVSTANASSSSGTVSLLFQTATNGTFRAAVPTTGTYTITPISENYLFTPTTQTVSISTATLVIPEFRATPIFIIRGRITRNTASAQSVQGQKIMLLPGQLEAITDANGNYAFPRLPASRYRIAPSVRFDGSFTPRRADILLSNSDITRNFTLEALRLYRVSGILKTLNGDVMRGVRVQVVGTTFATTQTNNAGEYNFMLQSGTYKITPSAEGFGFSPVELNITVADTSITSLDFTGGAAIVGRIVGENGQAVAGVTLETRAGALRRRTTTDSAGVYQFNNLTTGTYTIKPSRDRTIFNPPNISVEAPRTMTQGGTETGFRAAQTSFAILGTVMARSNSASTATTSAANISVALLRDNTVLGRAITDSSGRYLFRNVPRGAYRVAIAANDYIFPVVQTTASVTTADVRIAPFVGQKLSTILVQVQNSSVSNRGIAGVSVSISSATTATGRTDSTGRLFFTNVLNGTYTITVRRSGFQPSSLSQMISIDGTVNTTANFSLRQNGFDLPGQIIFNRTDSSAGSPLGDVAIAVTGRSAAGEMITKNEATDEDGNFLITDIQPGAYTFTVKREGFTFRPLRDVSIPPFGKVFTFDGTNGTISLPNLGLLGNSVYEAFAQSFLPPVMLAFRSATSASMMVEGRLLRIKSQYEFDAGEGAIWKPNGDGTYSTGTSKNMAALNANTRIKLNKFLVIEAPSLTINPENGIIQAAQGRIFAENIPFAGKRGEFVLYDGAINLNLTTAANAGLAFVAKGIEKASKIFGVAVKIDTLRFLGDITNARGVRVVGSLDLLGIFSCGQAKTPIRIDNLDILRKGVNFAGNVQNIGTPTICLTRLDAQYDSEEDRFRGRGTIEMPFMPIKGATVGIEIIAGEVNRLNLSANTTITTPFGYITRLGGGVEGLARENFSVYLQGQMSSLLPGLWEVDVEQLRYTHPSLINFDAELRAVDIPQFGWQGIGNVSVEMDWNKYFSFYGRFRLGTFDEGDSYAVDGNTAMLYSWKPEKEFIGQISGDVMIPRFGSREKCGWNPFCYVKKATGWIINRLGNLPLPLGYMDVVWQNKIVKGQFGARERSRLGSRQPQHFVIDFNESILSRDFFRTEVGMIELNPRLRPRNNSSGIAVARTGGEEPKISLVRSEFLQNQKQSAQLTFAAMERIPLGSSIGVAVIAIQSPDIVPASTLMSPSGKLYTPEKLSDEAEYKEAEEGGIAHWTLYDPEPGTWTLSAPQARDVDSLDVFAFPKERSFAIQARTNTGTNQVRVTWDSVNASTNASVNLYLDTDNQDLNGIFLGSVPERLGAFTYTLSDSLSACQYFIYAIRNENDVMATSYAPQIIANPKPTLAAPARIIALPSRDVPLEGFVAWQSSSSTVNINGYIISVRNAERRDSVYALTFGRQDSITLKFAQAGRYQVRMASFTEDGRQGCFSDTIGVTISNRPISVWQEAREKADEQRELVSVSPNPTRNTAVLTLNLPQAGNVRLTMLNTLGQRVMTLLDDVLNAGRQEVSFDCSALPTGLYLYRCEYENKTYTGTVSIIR